MPDPTTSAATVDQQSFSQEAKSAAARDDFQPDYEYAVEFTVQGPNDPEPRPHRFKVTDAEDVERQIRRLTNCADDYRRDRFKRLRRPRGAWEPYGQSWPTPTPEDGGFRA